MEPFKLPPGFQTWTPAERLTWVIDARKILKKAEESGFIDLFEKAKEIEGL